MKGIDFTRVCMVAIGATFVLTSHAYARDRGAGVLPPASAAMTSEPVGLPLAPEAEVFTREGIPPARASEALNLQREVAETHLAAGVQTALGSAYAGMWFEPAAAQFHIGVTSNASRQAAERAVAQAGLTAGVVETPVRSTWAALIATQSRLNKRLAKLLAAAQATTSIDSSHNAVSVTLSSAVPSPEHAVLEDEAAGAGVNVSVSVAPPVQLRFEPKAKKTCKAPFVKAAAFCEETLTSGVNLEFSGPECTAGPMLISGNETYVLTAGHCFGKGSGQVKAMFSKYPGVAGQKEVGREGTWFKNTERDTAEIKVKRPGSFTEPLPDPVPALMAEWVNEPKTPHAVGGVQAAEVTVPGQAVCHEGMTSGENCGQVKALNVIGPSGTEHLVEVTACSDSGDSGGPYFFRTKTGEVLMMGTEVGGPFPDCSEPGPYISKFEPLLDLPEAKGFGILSTFKGQQLLTTANEVRKVREFVAKNPVTQLKDINKGAHVFENSNGGKVECSTVESNASATQMKATTLKVAVNYSKCRAKFGFEFEAAVSKAEYLFSGNGTVSVENTFTIKVPVAGCEITVTPTNNKELGTITYANVTGPPKEVEIKAEVSGLVEEVKGSEATCGKSNSEGKYKGTSIEKAETGDIEVV